MKQPSTTPAALPQIKPRALQKFHAALATWYAAHGRHDLPWRKTQDPYHIWISEVMLQQTQVSTVLARFYFPFLERFPTVESLAAAPREAVMKAWEGLGYYRRAGHLHSAAQQAARAQPALFTTAGLGHNSRTVDAAKRDALLALPGIGKNTAHAILAFGFHQPVAILEANVKRVVARVFALTTPSDAQLWAGAEMLLNRDAPFDYNQAMMDVGSRICTPQKPDCPACPLQSLCAGQATPELFPAPKAKKQSPTRHVVLEVTEDAAGKLLLMQRNDALLGGLYGFAQRALPPAPHLPTIGHVTHIYSHFRLEGTVTYQRLTAQKSGKNWFTRAQIAALPLSKLDHKVLALVDAGHTPQKKSPKSRRHHREG